MIDAEASVTNVREDRSFIIHEITLDLGFSPCAEIRMDFPFGKSDQIDWLNLVVDAGRKFASMLSMSGSQISLEQMTAFSNCLHRIYGEPLGQNPVEPILDAIGEVVRWNSLAVDELKGDGSIQGNGTRLLRQSHLTSRGYDGHPWVRTTAFVTSRDHPIIQHVLKRGASPVLKMSDFVSQRQLREISLYDFNKQVHEWRDQAALVIPTAGGVLSLAINRDRVFSAEEFFLLQLLQPHLQRVLNRCAFFKRLPGNDQLTPREREVLYWVTQGKRDDEIACILSSSPRTVSKQVHVVMAKLGVENRASAVAEVLGGGE